MLVVGEGKTRIDVRSLWLLLAYSSEHLGRLTGPELEAVSSGERDNDLVDALADVLAESVSARLHSALSPRYTRRTAPLTRVRGRIDHLGTERRGLMQSGRILCRFEELSVDVPRYRHLLVTLREAAGTVIAPDVRQRCLDGAAALERSGVRPVDATEVELSREQYGHADSNDQHLVALSRLVRDLCAPEHQAGPNRVPAIVHDDGAMRSLFEKAVRAFYRLHLAPLGYDVSGARRRWPAEGPDDHLAFLPSLNVDVLLRSATDQTVVECKFGPIFTVHHDAAMLVPDYVRQVHCYCSVFAASAGIPTRGLLLGARVQDTPGRDLDLELAGFPVRVRQIDLGEPPSRIRAQLLDAVGSR